MKHLLLIIVISFIIPITVKAQDTIVKKNGDVMLCKIQKEDSTNLYISLKKEGQYINTYVKRNEIRYFKYGGEFIETSIPSEKLSLGCGLGLDYGGVGLNFALYPHKNFGFFAGLGTALAGAGFNAGLKIRLIPKEGIKRITPFFTLMYGYNAAIMVQNRTELNKLFYGPTFGFGLDFRRSQKARLYTSMSILLPIRNAEVEDYMKNIEDEYGVSFKSGLFPIGFSIGANFILNKPKVNK
jgi:hypothetical protein